MGIPIQRRPDGRLNFTFSSSSDPNPKVDELLTCVRALPPDEMKGFLEHMFTRMTLSAKEAIADILWSTLTPAEQDAFELPSVGGNEWTHDQIINGLNGLYSASVQSTSHMRNTSSGSGDLDATPSASRTTWRRESNPASLAALLRGELVESTRMNVRQGGSGVGVARRMVIREDRTDDQILEALLHSIERHRRLEQNITVRPALNPALRLQQGIVGFGTIVQNQNQRLQFRTLSPSPAIISTAKIMQCIKRESAKMIASWQVMNNRGRIQNKIKVPNNSNGSLYNADQNQN
ncbi:hypothetical protein BJ742DRAFT_882417 [Cladochytrium replicatum]|nr:hypothetical protein BJ742DRAFT_882417 [Cladochytrium replicatum]